VVVSTRCSPAGDKRAFVEAKGWFRCPAGIKTRDSARRASHSATTQAPTLTHAEQASP
jgi:hypothetical protein